MAKSEIIYIITLIIILFFTADNLSGFFFENIVDTIGNPLNSPITVKNTVINDTYSFYDVLFFPSNTSREKLMSYLVNAKSLKCSFYDFDDYFFEMLVNKSSSLNHTINADIFIFNRNRKHLNFAKKSTDNFFKINSKNLNMTLIFVDKNKGLMHNKFCILDNNAIITGSMNPTNNGVNKNNNNLFIIDSKRLAQNYLYEFYEEKSESKDKPNEISKFHLCHISNSSNCFYIENYFCPEDSCELNVFEELNTSKDSIYFYTFSFTSKNIANLMVLKSKNINITGIFDKSQVGKYSMMDYLSPYINVMYDKNKYKMHHKVFVIDKNKVIFGSYNPSNNGNKYNDENILIIDNKDIALKYYDEFVTLS